MRKKPLLLLILLTLLFVGLFIANSSGSFVISQVEYLSLPENLGGQSIPLGNTDGMLILGVLSFVIIFIPAFNYLRKK